LVDLEASNKGDEIPVPQFINGVNAISLSLTESYSRQTNFMK
jgi:hypothetical protein